MQTESDCVLVRRGASVVLVQTRRSVNWAGEDRVCTVQDEIECVRCRRMAVFTGADWSECVWCRRGGGGVLVHTMSVCTGADEERVWTGQTRSEFVLGRRRSECVTVATRSEWCTGADRSSVYWCRR